MTRARRQGRRLQLEGWTAVDKNFVAHWDFTRRWFKEGPWKGIKIPRKSLLMALVLVIEEWPPADPTSGLEQIVDLFQQRELPVYFVQPSKSTFALPHRPSDAIDTLVFAGDVSGGVLTHLCYSSFDAQFDIMLVEDAIFVGKAVAGVSKARFLDDLVDVMRHAVAYVTSIQEIQEFEGASSVNSSLRTTHRQGPCIATASNEPLTTSVASICEHHCEQTPTCAAGIIKGKGGLDLNAYCLQSHLFWRNTPKEVTPATVL